MGWFIRRYGGKSGSEAAAVAGYAKAKFPPGPRRDGTFIGCLEAIRPEPIPAPSASDLDQDVVSDSSVPTNNGVAPSYLTSEEADAYETEWFVCGTVTLEDLAAEVGAEANPHDVALAVTLDYVGDLRQAAYEGCLDGIRYELEHP